MSTRILRRTATAAVAAAIAAHAGTAAAIEFQIGENTLKVDNLFTIGASWRMQDRDPSLIGKSSLYRLENPITAPGVPSGLCLTRALDDGVNGPNGATANNQYDVGTYTVGFIARGCTTSDDAATPAEPRSEANLAYVAARGSYSPNGDDGNLNFDKGDIVHAVAKLTSDISFSFQEFNLFVRPIYYFDLNYSDFETNYADTTLQARQQGLGAGAVEQVGSNLQVLDYNISRTFAIGERNISVKVGNQVLSWGESALLIFNSLNFINPPDATKLRLPGLDLKELTQPLGMVVIGADIMDGVSLETWYQYQWKPLVVDPPGTYFSQSDTLGAGGRYAMLSFGKVPDDPGALYEAIDAGATVDTTAALGSHSSRTIFRDAAEESRLRPDGGGQYGVKVQLFLEDFNNGTELSLYHANYHSRIPAVSLFAAQDTCLVTLGSFLGDCTVSVTPNGLLAAEEPLPVDTARLVVEYPEDIRLYGVSFNTTVGDFALAGEYAYRENLPTQIHTTDLTFAALNPAFPVAPVGPVPSRRQAVPDFVSVYRGISGGYGANDYIRGYERLKTGQANISLVKLIGGDNPLGASQMTILFEMGMNQVFGMPGLDELQFQGGGHDTHISNGADGTGGINVDDPAIDQATVAPGARQNPTAHADLAGFGTSESYGYRLLNLNRWDSALFGANLETLAIIQHDVKGTTPGIGTNFLEGRKQYAFGLRFDYLSRYIGEVRYSWNTGGARRDGLRDRDNIQVSFGFQF
jgi:hypothetical protein